MFWKVAGFSQPSSLEQLLDKNEFTLEELLDEDDIIQECKSLNGRLVAFLRERTTVDQLVRYLVEPPLDASDPKKVYKYPFTACEVLCCEVEAVYSTLVEDPELLGLLFSLLDAAPPLNSKTAGYFGRVLSQLLVRKTAEMMAHLQDTPRLLERLVAHVDTTSIADVIKRIAGADEQSLVVLAPHQAQWLAESRLVDLLLQRLAPSYSPDVQSNVGDILAAIAHIQPSPLATKLMRPVCVAALLRHVLSPDKQRVLLPVLDVCVALVEPKRLPVDGAVAGTGPGSIPDSPVVLPPIRSSSSFADMSSDAVGSSRAKVEAVRAMLPHASALVEYLAAIAGPNATAAAAASSLLPTALPLPYGLLCPPLGRPRLKVVELLTVLVRCGDVVAERVLVDCAAIETCLELFRRYPFHNLLHNLVASMVASALTRSSMALLQHLFTGAGVLDWLVGLPSEIRPEPRPGHECFKKPPLRAGYLGQVMQLGALVDALSGGGGIAPQPPAQPPAQPPPQRLVASSSGGDVAGQGNGDASAVKPLASFVVLLEGVAALPPARLAAAAAFADAHSGWLSWRSTVLQPRLEVENVQKWACGRPAVTAPGGIDSDGDEFQNDLDLEAISGMQSGLYHRYQAGGEAEDEEDEIEDAAAGLRAQDGTLRSGGLVSSFGATAVAEGIARLHLLDIHYEEEGSRSPEEEDEEDEELDRSQEDDDARREMEEEPPCRGSAGSSGEGFVEDDEVLLANSDEELSADEQEATMVAEAVEGDIPDEAMGHGSGDVVIVEEDIPEAILAVSGLAEETISGAKGSATSPRAGTHGHGPTARQLPGQLHTATGSTGSWQSNKVKL